MTKRHGMASIYPATRWENAFPSGNGSLAALVFGNICEDTIILNHEALWLPRSSNRSPGCFRISS